MKEQAKDRLDSLTIAATSKDAEGLKTVELAVEKGAVKILSGRTEQIDFEQWGKGEQSHGDNERKVMAGFDSSVTAFYRLSVPDVKPEEFENIIRLQAETKFPLPGEQIEIAWRADEVTAGQCEVTVVGSRKDILEKFADKVKSVKPAKIVLECEAIVRVWQKLFSGSESNAIVVSIGAGGCQVCLVKNGKLVNAASLDTGLEDAEDKQRAGYFIQDISSSLDMFNGHGTPVFLLSDGNEKIEEIGEVLSGHGFDCRVCLPEKKPFGIVSKLGREDVYRYRVCIGVGLMGLDQKAGQLDIFKNVYFPGGKKKTAAWYESWKAAVGVTAAAIVLALLGLFVIDVIAAKNWEKSGQCEECRKLIAKQKVVGSIAKRRVDILDLLNKVNATENNGIEIYNFSFKQGQAVVMRGQAPNPEELVKFEKSLAAQQGISEVKQQNPKKDEKSGKVNFNMTLHYKTFTSKKKGLL